MRDVDGRPVGGPAGKSVRGPVPGEGSTDQRRAAGQRAGTRVIKGRGAVSNTGSRYLPTQTIYDEGVHPEGNYVLESTPAAAAGAQEHLPSNKACEFYPDLTRRLITRNKSPDIPFDRSINAYKGCEHGCVYCFARPTHAYLDLSPGLDFETQIFYKTDVEALLTQELARPAYRPAVIALGTNTDPYQPVEKRLRSTRQILEVLLAHRHPVSIVTKGALIERDIDLLAELATYSLVSVMLSITTLDNTLKSRLEPRAASAARRLAAVRDLRAAGVPVGVMVAPVIPWINDMELESILEQSAAAGAQRARYILLRLPAEVRELFAEWLHAHYPERAEHVLNLVRDTRGGELYRARWGERMRGTGAIAELLAKRFQVASRKCGLMTEGPTLRTDLFRVPSPQRSLF